MNKHKSIDKFTLLIAHWLSGSDKFFSSSIESPTYMGNLVNIEVEVPEIGQEGVVELEAHTLAGQLSIAYNVVQWKGKAYPTLIYHHGNNERPFDFRRLAKNTFYNIFLRGQNLPEANLVIIRAAFHDDDLKTYRKKMSSMANFTAMLSLSARLIEELIMQLKQQQHKVIIAGISLGGLATNLHRTYYNTADAYVPMLSGVCPAETFLNSPYKVLTGKLALDNAAEVRKILNFDQDFVKVKQSNIFPLLARFDEYIPYKANKHAYIGHPLQLIAMGHITASMSTDILRQHIIEVIDAVTNNTPELD